MPDPDREQLIKMVEGVQNASACVMDFDGMLTRLEKKIGYPKIGKLIFDPPGGKRLSAGKIVDIALEKKQ